MVKKVSLFKIHDWIEETLEIAENEEGDPVEIEVTSPDDESVTDAEKSKFAAEFQKTLKQLQDLEDLYHQMF